MPPSAVSRPVITIRVGRNVPAAVVKSLEPSAAERCKLTDAEGLATEVTSTTDAGVL